MAISFKPGDIKATLADWRRWSRSPVFLAWFFGTLCMLCLYLFVQWNEDNKQIVNGWYFISFLLIQPFCISAFISWYSDPHFDRGHFHYMACPVYLAMWVVFCSVVFFFEGLICIIMIVPIWAMSGLLGSNLVWLIRRRRNDPPRRYAFALLVLPLLALQIEGLLPQHTQYLRVERSVTIAADSAQVWPYLRSIEDIRSDEGQWNFSQSVAGVPRPLSAVLTGSGKGAVRKAWWGENIYFEEHILAEQPGKLLQWKFVFPDRDLANHVDQHINPDSYSLKILNGGYRLDALGKGRTRVTLYTDYRVRSWLGGYMWLWGEVFLGDIQNNILDIVRHRAERDI